MLKLINGDSEIQSKIQDLWRATWLNPKFKFIHCNYWEPIVFEENTWIKEHYAVMNGENIVGYFEVCISRITNSATIDKAVNFTDDVVVMGKAFYDLLRILIYRSYHKVEWYVIQGNPISKTYHRLCSRVGGQIEGRDRDGVKLWDGTYSDIIHFGILFKEYSNSKTLNRLRYNNGTINGKEV